MKSNFSKAIHFLFTLVIILSFSRAAATAATGVKRLDFNGYVSYKFIAVLDGDTITVRVGNKTERVRLIGIDCPETDSGSSVAQKQAKAATDFTKKLLRDEARVYVIPDAADKLRDRYNRLLGYVYRASDGLFVNREIVKKGFGMAYRRFPFKFKSAFIKLEKKAKKKKLGVWAFLKKRPSIKTLQKDSSVSATGEDTVYVTRTGKKYHMGSCRHLRKSRIPTTVNKAKEAGFQPCARCGPPW